MNIKNLISHDYDGEYIYTGISGFFSAYGSFGVVDGKDSDVKEMKKNENGFSFENDSFSVVSEYEDFENGVVLRKDFFTAKTDLELNRYTSRFCLEGGEYEVYTQFSCWHTESLGGWQDLVTGVEVSNLGIRTTEGAAPMIALKNKGNGKILVLHLLPNAQWKIKVSKYPVLNKDTAVIIETGINDNGLKLKVAKGETIDMPSIILYEAKSQLDLDAWKLHNYYNKLYPRKKLPVIYNTWLSSFDTIDVDNVKEQAKCSAELGVEQFIIDAGWFGNTEKWDNEIGNWDENFNGGYKGRVKELSDYVRSLGMKFGMWIEPERALKNTENFKNHPDYFIDGTNGNGFLNFANPDAVKFITDIVLGLIEKYNLEYMKFDFNAPLSYNPSGDGFYRYFKGTKQFIKNIKDRYPDFYITNCASGGNRMDLENQKIYDSVWSSDNQSPIYGFRIFKDTALRMPPCHIEKWDVRRFFHGFPEYGNRELVTLPISCNGATWTNVLNVTSRYTHQFMTGGPIGFSTDIVSYPEDEKRALKEHIKQFKEDREFYRTASMRVLYDTDNLTAIEYSDSVFNRVKVQIFTNILNQDRVTVYPVVDENKTYTYNGEALSGKEITESGITVKISDIDCIVFDLKEI